MQTHQYRVVWKREDLPRKTKIYQTLKGAERFMAILGTEPWEPWVAFGQDPDGMLCCSGVECGCGGQTVREHWVRGHEGVPPVEFVHLECRTVGQWTEG